MDNRLTPAEIAKLLEDPDYKDLPFAIRPLLANGQPPVSYIRERWSEDASYYTANRGARSLIVVFCGAGKRPGVSISYFLQMLREDLYDVVILRDPQNLHYVRGVHGLGSFLDTVHRIKAFSEANKFREIITYGISMGGYPALRAGLLLNADRAISISGRYCWHVGRLVRNEEAIEAFDLLCPCGPRRPTQMIAVVGSRNQDDMMALQTLRATFPECIPILIDTDTHNIAWYFYQVGLLRLLYACLFEFWHHRAIVGNLLVLLEQTARERDALRPHRAEDVLKLQQSLSEARLHAKTLEAVYRSRSWRLTEPLRLLVKAVRRLRGPLRGV